MTIQGIEVILSVVQTGSVSETARKLFLTQPAVSRHLTALEEEIGCPLLLRRRGHRKVELTEEGRRFVPAAEKVRQSWQDALTVPQRDARKDLRVACIGSLCSFLTNETLFTFLTKGENRELTFLQMHSPQGYHAVDSGEVDIALIAEDMYYPRVETIPLFSEPMVLLVHDSSPFEGVVHPSQLDPSREIRQPWNPDYDMWHSYWFRSGDNPRMTVNYFSLMEGAFSWRGKWENSWAIAPVLTAQMIASRTGARICGLEDGPPDEIIYYLLGQRRKEKLVESFLECVREQLRKHSCVSVY